MSVFYTPKYLKPEELVPREMYQDLKRLGKIEYILWQFNPLVLMTADLLRERFGAITVNNWHSGGSWQNRGLRLTSAVGAKYGPHLRGAALDCNFKDATPPEIRKEMEKAGCFEPGFKNKKNFGEDACFKYIGRVENTQNGKQIGWFHFDIWNNQPTDGSILRFDV